jgi:acetyl esterase/lipase
MVINQWSPFQALQPSLYHEHEVFCYGQDKDPTRSLYVSKPVLSQTDRVIIWFHGGGLEGDLREIATGLYDGKNTIVEVRHRVLPKVSPLEIVDDAVLAVKWVSDNLLSRNGKLFIGGMSAGCYLAALVTFNQDLRLKFGEVRKADGLLFLSGQMTTHFNFKRFSNYDSSQYAPIVDQYAPLSHLSSEIPPVIFVTGQSGMDIPARPEENAFAAASLKALGHKHVEYYALPGHNHGMVVEGSSELLLQFIEKISIQ